MSIIIGVKNNKESAAKSSTSTKKKGKNDAK